MVILALGQTTEISSRPDTELVLVIKNLPIVLGNEIHNEVVLLAESTEGQDLRPTVAQFDFVLPHHVGYDRRYPKTVGVVSFNQDHYPTATHQVERSILELVVTVDSYLTVHVLSIFLLEYVLYLP